jgi:hypothetical protein
MTGFAAATPARFALYRVFRRPSSPPLRFLSAFLPTAASSVCLSLHRRVFCRPFSPPSHLLSAFSAFLSTAAVRSPRKAAPPDCCCRLHRGRCVHSITRDCIAACLLSSSFSNATVQLGSRYVVLCPPDYHVLLKSVCFECFRCILKVSQMDVTK